MKTINEIEEIVQNCSYLDWEIRVRDDNGRPYLQIFGYGPDPHTGNDEHWSSRKWMLSPWMCKNEIVRTAHKAVEGAVLHEMNEHFKYKDAQIVNPHMDIDLLVEMSAREDFVEVRPDILKGV